MSNGSSSKVAPWVTGGAVGQGDSSHRLGRPRRSPSLTGQTGSPSMSADSTLSSKHATGKVLDVPDDIEPQPMFPYQDPSYMERQRNKPQAMQNRKGVVLRLTRSQLREYVRDQFEKDGIDITDNQINEFISAIPRIAGTFGRTMVANFADDAISNLVGRFGGGPLSRALQRFLPAGASRFVGTEMATKAIMLGKEIFGDLPSAIKKGQAAIDNFDSYMAQNPLNQGDAFTDSYYTVENPLREAKLEILRNLIDMGERLAPGSGLRGVISTSLKGTGVALAADQFDAMRDILSITGKVIPGDDTIEQAFDMLEELDMRIDSISSFVRPTGELDGGPVSGVGPMSSPMSGGMALMEAKNILRMLMELDELDEKSPEDDDDDVDEFLSFTIDVDGDGEVNTPGVRFTDPISEEGAIDELDDLDIAYLESDEDVDEASGAGAVAGFVAPLHYDPKSGQRMRKMYSRHYKTVGPELKPKP